jgi:ferredoxin-nitrate reductase
MLRQGANMRGKTILGSSRDSTADIWGATTPYFGDGQWPARVDWRLDQQADHWVQSACVLCSNGCGIDIGVANGRIVGVRGREVDRCNRGRLGPKGMCSWQANNSGDRLVRPLIRVKAKSAAPHMSAGAFREASWEEAMNLIVDRSRNIIEQYTGEAIAFYNSGQLFLEDYYTLGVVAHCGVRTHQVDGNTRLCTATAAMALRESFGCDGQPGSYEDIDLADCLFLAGHNVSSTQTVLWMRIRDRLSGSHPPRLIVLDPRKTVAARHADVHLAVRPGTNVAALNGLLRCLIARGAIDEQFINEHTVGFAELSQRVRPYTSQRVEEITGIPARMLEKAAELIGSAKALVSTCLQGIYQSNQATAAAVQVNNINLIRGMIGKPGCTVFQMNGQPTSQNTRETGCNGEYAGFRNYQNPSHMAELARLWNVESERFPHWSTKEHAMEIFEHAEAGSTKMLWIMGTNPAVSLPELKRIRRILASSGLFVVVNDAFMTETAMLADVILPVALWGEKTGTFTNTDRTVHISHKAVDPPGEARSDMDILLDFSDRMVFKDKDGAPLVKWRTAEAAFKAWQECSGGRPCDYSGLSYAKLSEGSGIQWPCNTDYPNGRARLYTDFQFLTGAEQCEAYGHDLDTGSPVSKQHYFTNDPKGRAIFRAADYQPPPEEPDQDYPFYLTTGRVTHHFHTRTKTGRTPELQQAAPECYVQVSQADATRLNIEDDECVEVATRRGEVRLKAKIGDIEDGTLFIPFHFGYWDHPGDHPAANELALTVWDPISKQPCFKCGSAFLRKARLHPLERTETALGHAVQAGVQLVSGAAHMIHSPRQHVEPWLARATRASEAFVDACESIKAQHSRERTLGRGLTTLAQHSREVIGLLEQLGMPAVNRRQHSLVPRPSGGSGAIALLEQLHNLLLHARDVEAAVVALKQAYGALGDRRGIERCENMHVLCGRQISWCEEQLLHRAGHALTVPQ